LFVKAGLVSLFRLETKRSSREQVCRPNSSVLQNTGMTCDLE